MYLISGSDINDFRENLSNSAQFLGTFGYLWVLLDTYGYFWVLLSVFRYF